MGIEEKCAWKEIVEIEDNPEGGLIRCKRCNGYNTKCESYSLIKKREL